MRSFIICTLQLILPAAYFLLLPLRSFVLLQFLNPKTIGRTPWTGDQPDARSLPTHRTTQTHNKRTQTSMPWVGFEPTIPVFERPKAFHALGRAATVIGQLMLLRWSNQGRSARCGMHDAWREIRNAYKILVEKHEGKRPREDLDADGRITLKWIVNKEGDRMWTGFI
jgi:hypothetical protein